MSLLQSVVEQLLAKIIAKYDPGCKDCGQSLLAEYVKANSTIMALLQDGRGTVGCEDHCKYEGTAD